MMEYSGRTTAQDLVVIHSLYAVWYNEKLLKHLACVLIRDGK
jgi:hypothetical protein